MSQSNESENDTPSAKQKSLTKTKLFLPDADIPDVCTEDLISGEIVHAIDGTAFILVLAKPNLHFFVQATGPNIEVLSKFIVIANAPRPRLKSVDLPEKLIALKPSSDEGSKKLEAEIVFYNGQQIVVIIDSEHTFYFEYDLTAKNALRQENISIGLQLGGTTNPNDYTPG